MSDQVTDALREQVRSRYAQAARAVLEPGTDQAGCGEPSAASCSAALAVGEFSQGLYRDGETDGLPADAVLASLGCGNPLAVAELRESERLLDLGSGGGIDVLLSARRVGPSGFAWGVDMTDDMLELARANAAKAGAANVGFLKGQIEDVPLPDGSVDVVISNCVINLSTDKPAVLAEMFRVLAPRRAARDLRHRGRGSHERGGPGGGQVLRRVHRRGAVPGRVPGRAGGGPVRGAVGDVYP
jgi:arsenite methyltransferase